ncbi:MAG: hypothetical protein ACE5IJ_06610, partial [Thermoplasmata archaeon]
TIPFDRRALRHRDREWGSQPCRRDDLIDVHESQVDSVEAMDDPITGTLYVQKHAFKSRPTGADRLADELRALDRLHGTRWRPTSPATRHDPGGHSSISFSFPSLSRPPSAV